MDEDGIEAKGLTPLEDEPARISAIANKSSLSAYLGTTLTGEVDGLTANADHIFGLWVNQGFEDAGHNVVHSWQGGLGMPDRDNHIDASPKMVALWAKYQTHITAVLSWRALQTRSPKPRVSCHLRSELPKLSRQTPMPLMSSNRTTPGRASTSASRRPAWTGMLISNPPALTISPFSSFGSRRR